jgi:hypothetical protein
MRDIKSNKDVTYWMGIITGGMKRKMLKKTEEYSAKLHSYKRLKDKVKQFMNLAYDSWENS